ncbi:MAG: O-methyltransferase [Halanaeroarchaeum sp.]
MSQYLDEDVVGLLSAGFADPDPIVDEMTQFGRERGFPIVGPEVGRFLRVAATMVEAERVFEFGSGFGYSAVWFAGAVPPDGDLLLTDYDADNADRAREFLSRAGYGDVAEFHVGDAMEVFETVPGTFDVVLIDHEKTEYVAAFERAAPRVNDGGVVVADNVIGGPVEPRHVRNALEGGDPVDDTTAGIVEYVETVRDHDDFETALVPLGEGIAISVKR